ncbi:Hsp70 protein-domain-containing protein [Tribonema minus]|uniref:Hsp70 protein-domain-containing protein n=1 Tax=Tribonema minus TaxID=303371 RepID=A0A835ZI26_9STRA|nr:Hsp70 protein-domain-containing protein [Tribonema minus]
MLTHHSDTLATVTRPPLALPLAADTALADARAARMDPMGARTSAPAAAAGTETEPAAGGGGGGAPAAAAAAAAAMDTGGSSSGAGAGGGSGMAYIGIDLGTTCCVVGAWVETGVDKGEVRILENEEGYLTTPSCVVFSDDDILVGDNARAQAAAFPASTVVGAKRLLGRGFADPDVQALLHAHQWPIAVVEGPLGQARRYVCLLRGRRCADADAQALLHAHQWPFAVVEGPLGQAMIRVEVRGQPKDYSPEEISGMILGRLKRLAEEALGTSIGGAVITVPAHFTSAQREGTKTAAAMAGLNLLRLMDEPTAACIAYGVLTGVNRMKLSTERNILVVDIGGGTTGITIASVGGGFNVLPPPLAHAVCAHAEYDVLSTAGDTMLGGEDFDARLLLHCVAAFERQTAYGVDVRSNPRALRRLRSACERAKIALSGGDVAAVAVEGLVAGVDFNIAIAREQFEDMCMDLFKRCIDLVMQAMADAKMQPQQVHEVVLMGGSSRVPRLREMVAALFVPAGATISTAVNPDEGEAMGATGTLKLKLVRSPFSGGSIAIADHVCCHVRRAVLIYAAMLGGKMSPDLEDLLLLNVTPFSLGLETAGGLTHVMLNRNTKVPARRVQLFTTCCKDQTSALLQVVEGEARRVCDARLLGRVRLPLPPAPARAARVEVVFDVNTDRELRMRALDVTQWAKQACPRKA